MSRSYRFDPTDEVAFDPKEKVQQDRTKRDARKAQFHTPPALLRNERTRTSRHE